MIEGTSQKLPVKLIIGFLEVQLQEDPPLVLGPDLMDNLMQGQNPIVDKTTLHEGRLKGVCDTAGHRGHPNGTHLRHEALQHVNNRDSAKLTNLCRPKYFG